MMEPVAISWLIASSSSPLVAVLALWTIYVFHTYRRRWRTVDLFLLAVTAQELVTSIFTFCYAIISLINPPFRAPCHFTQWGLIATRTFQIATLTSMIVDRALTVRWPYRYRFSVRRNQIRYHIAVLALVSVLVGVAATFARLPKESKHCHLHPAQLDVKYTVFLFSLYGVLMVVSFICMIQVEVHRSKHGTKLGANGSFQLPECASPELPSATGMNSPLDTQSSTGSTRALHRPSRQASRRPYGKNNKSTSDLRWPSVALTSLLCFSLNHIPHLVLMCLATWSPYLWSPWHEAILAWLRLLEGVIVPLLLFCRDHALRSALRRTFQRRSGALSPLVGDDGPFQMYFDKDHFRKRGTFGSVTPIGIITNYRRTPGKKRRTRKNSGKYTLPGLHNGDSVLAKSCLSAGFLATEPLSKLSCADLTSLEMWREEDEENFYATLSDDFSTFSCKSADDSALSEDIRISEELYGGSFTTIANDDFEFHDTRPCGGEVRMKPALTSTPPKTNSFNGGFSRNVSFKENTKLQELRNEKTELQRACDLFDFTRELEEKDDHKDPNIFSIPSSERKNKKHNSKPKSLETKQVPCRETKEFGTISRHQKTTSYSMNDLDLIHKRGNPGQDIDATFILPVKSESTMSLYRLNVERDIDQMILTPSRSENNVNGDSGFGSGAQSTNPVWSGFLCRKPSDPFWNMRKPTTHTSAMVSPTKNYPGILHPRMRKIPWISAWKKLDENSLDNRHKTKDSEMKDGSLGWKENMVYVSNVEGITGNPRDNQVATIDEELSDVSTPLYNGDYNMNIFAKESGVLLENAYGKIVRDDCGVKVNFYGENVQYEGRDVANGSKDFSMQENGFEPEKQILEQGRYGMVLEEKIENHYQPLNPLYNEVTEPVKDNDLFYARSQAVEDLFCRSADIEDNVFKCELRSSGGHYENLFGTKENIFAHCDQNLEKNKIAYGEGKLERKASGRRDSGRFKDVHGVFPSVDANSAYGQLKKVERRESFSRKNDELPETRIKNLCRKESDNKGKCGIRRKESRIRSERSEIPRPIEAPPFIEMDNKIENGMKSSGADKNGTEIEMKSVWYGRNDLSSENKVNKMGNNAEIRTNLNPYDGQNRVVQEHDNSNEQIKSKLEKGDGELAKPNNDKRVKLDRRESQGKDKEHSRERRANLERRESGRQARLEQKDNACKADLQCNINKKSANAERRDSGRKVRPDVKEGVWPLNLECGRPVNVQRKESVKQVSEDKDVGCQSNVERRDSDRRENNVVTRKEERRSRVPRRDSRIKRNEAKNEGLWVNAIPFHIQNSNCDRDEENGNAVRRDSQKDSHDLQRSPKKANLIRKESKNRDEKPTVHVKRKISANRGKKEKTDVQEVREYNDVRNRITRKEIYNRARATDVKWTQQENDAKRESNLDDFIKYRDKCEDNFSHIQNLNRETSAERETSRVDQLITYGKLNGNLPPNGEAYPFETFQEPRRPHFVASSKPVYDVNENCRPKKLAITDFL